LFSKGLSGDPKNPTALYAVNHPAAIFLKLIEKSALCFDKPLRAQKQECRFENILVQVVSLYFLVAQSIHCIKTGVAQMEACKYDHIKNETLSFIENLIQNCEENLTEGGPNPSIKYTLEKLKNLKENLKVTHKRFEQIEKLLTECEEMKNREIPNKSVIYDFLSKVNQQLGQLRIGTNVVPVFDQSESPIIAESGTERTECLLTVIHRVLLPYYAAQA